MKRQLSAALMASLLLCSSGCGKTPSPKEDETLHILATTYPVYLFTTAITQGAEGVEVSLLVNQQTSCLHDYTLTVNDMKAIEQADIVVMNGAGLEDFMSDALSHSKAPVIDCSEKIELRPAQGHEDHDHEAEYDPHIWLTEEAAAVMMSNISSGLGTLDPDHLTLYTENLSTAVSALPEDPFRDRPLAHPYLITFHDGFQYFAQDNGLTLLKAIEEEEGSEASAAEIREIVELIREYDLPAIFTEKNASDSTAQAIARETGVQIYELDLIMSGEGIGIQPYVDAMKANYQTIRDALQ